MILYYVGPDRLRVLLNAGLCGVFYERQERTHALFALAGTIGLSCLKVSLCPSAKAHGFLDIIAGMVKHTSILLPLHHTCMHPAAL
jgi:hypothetical protein